MNDTQHELEHLSLVGGLLCLDFVNTASARYTESPTERLFTYNDLVAWAERAEIVSADLGRLLHAEAVRRPDSAAAVFQRAVELREALFRVFYSVIAHAAPSADDLAVLNSHVAASYPQLRLAHSGSEFVWMWADDGIHLDRILWPVVRSAVEELTTGELDRISMCAGEHCGWLFVDRSKNHSRRWCDMKECGNVAKVRRYRRRRQQ